MYGRMRSLHYSLVACVNLSRRKLLNEHIAKVQLMHCSGTRKLCTGEGVYGTAKNTIDARDCLQQTDLLGIKILLAHASPCLEKSLQYQTFLILAGVAQSMPSAWSSHTSTHESQRHAVCIFVEFISLWNKVRGNHKKVHFICTLMESRLKETEKNWKTRAKLSNWYISRRSYTINYLLWSQVRSKRATFRANVTTFSTSCKNSLEVMVLYLFVQAPVDRQSRCFATDKHLCRKFKANFLPTSEQVRDRDIFYV